MAEEGVLGVEDECRYSSRAGPRPFWGPKPKNLTETKVCKETTGVVQTLRPRPVCHGRSVPDP